jgi:hypothetical protein
VLIQQRVDVPVVELVTSVMSLISITWPQPWPLDPADL